MKNDTCSSSIWNIRMEYTHTWEAMEAFVADGRVKGKFAFQILNSALKVLDFALKNREFCIRNDGLCNRPRRLELHAGATAAPDWRQQNRPRGEPGAISDRFLTRFRLISADFG